MKAIKQWTHFWTKLCLLIPLDLFTVISTNIYTRENSCSKQAAVILGAISQLIPTAQHRALNVTG